MMRVRAAVLPALISACTTALQAQSVTVAPSVLVFSAYSGHGNPAPQSLAINGAYQVTSQHAAWLTVTPRSGAAAGSISVKVDATGLRAGKYQDAITVGSATKADTVPVIFVVVQTPAGPQGQFAMYEVEVSMSGYVGLVNGAPYCKVRTNGYDRLTGIVAGFETTGNDDDMVYYGTLRRDTNIDYCETKKAPTVDQRNWCEFGLTGSGVVDVEINVAYDSLAGAYMKAQPANAPMHRSIIPGSNTCDAPEVNDALNAYQVASDLGAGSPSGQQLDDVKAIGPNGQPQTFSAGGVTKMRVGTYPPDNRDGWTLRVIRKLP